ncbi:hypothetical protein [Nocardia aurantiaca]|uniref:Ig-like domain-containing protein n=1 Tax=Nocardia aurantiaca TaxID=2675850 RepID=A0A6I3LCH1_9NOCA|nr:hypothetical protein [Nocardia aurantiaca]MTE17529.1 hypothetical protein [Nocardia aurantiaca]
MNTTNTSRYAAIGTALMAAAIPLSTGTATAASGTANIWVGGGPDLLACQATAQTCALTAYVYDMSTAVTISVDGKALITGLPVASSGTVEPGKLAAVWTPQTAGQHVVSVQQGSQGQSVTVQIIDNNSPEAYVKRLESYVSQLICKSGSGNSGSFGCMQADPL